MGRCHSESVVCCVDDYASNKPSQQLLLLFDRHFPTTISRKFAN